MTDVIFDEEKARKVYGHRESWMTRSVINTGLAKTPKQAGGVLLVFALILIAFSIFFFMGDKQTPPAPGELPPTPPELPPNG